ncbi:MAG: hypothetical protein ACRDT7_08300 [Microbacterium sp.]
MTLRRTAPTPSPSRIVLSRIASSRIASSRIVIIAAALVTALAMTNGCSAPPAPREAKTPSPMATSPSEAPPDVLTFADGAWLTTDSDISWGDGLYADEGWTAVPSDHPGRWSYANASGTCTAAFRGGVLGESGGMDDREATDAVLEHQAGADWLGPELLSEGIFLPHEQSDRAVAQRQFSYTVNEYGYFMAARAFVQADYSVWVIVICEGEPVGPVAQEVLSKNVVAVDE